MYLSRVQLAMDNRNTMLALADSNHFHGALESCFSYTESRKLWRIDNVNGTMYLLVLSQEEPNLSPFCKQFSPSQDSWETKDYTPLLENLKADTIWRFRLTSNPTISHRTDKDKRGKVLAHITTEYQRKWLIERSEKNGFQLFENDFNVTGNKWQRFIKKDGRYVTFLSVTYEGLLNIKDVDLFRKVLTEGLGRGKAYGMGLMTVMRV